MIALKTRKKRVENFRIRATEEEKQLISRAAQKENKNITDFVLENALSAAEAVVQDKNNFALSGEKWESFCAALDAPPRDIPALRKLLTEKSVFDAGN